MFDLAIANRTWATDSDLIGDWDALDLLDSSTSTYYESTGRRAELLCKVPAASELGDIKEVRVFCKMQQDKQYR